jgi:hypothetical protein
MADRIHLLDVSRTTVEKIVDPKPLGGDRHGRSGMSCSSACTVRARAAGLHGKQQQRTQAAGWPGATPLRGQPAG